jgi:hypothetical protein
MQTTSFGTGTQSIPRYNSINRKEEEKTVILVMLVVDLRHRHAKRIDPAADKIT